LRRPLAQIIPLPNNEARRAELEAFLEDMIEADVDASDPRMQVNRVSQGSEGGLNLVEANDGPDLLDEDDE
jgi:hypothetical protein